MNLQTLKDSSGVQKTLQYIKDHKLVLVLIAVILVILVYTFRKPTENHSPLGLPTEPLKIPLTTSLDTAPRTSTSDANVELNQKYTAKVNGQTVSIPVTTLPAPNGIKGIITQEVDMTPVVDKAVKDGVAKAKVNWELGTGLGIHNGDLYIPLEIQRNYKKDKAVVIEIHKDLQGSKVSGGELKHKWLF